MSDEGGTTTTRFESLRVPDFKRLWWGGIFVFLAMQTQQIARSWLAFELTGTNTALGGVLIGFGIAGLIAIPIGGVLADRFNKRTILIVTQSVNTVTAFTLAIAIETGAIAYWMLVAASVVGGSSISILAPARIAMTADLVDRHLLTNAIILGTMSTQASRVVGPAVAGVMIGISAVGVEGVYYLSAALSAVSVALTLTLPQGAPTNPSGRSPINDLRDGISYVRARPELVRLLTMSLLVIMFGFGHVVFLPAIISDLYTRGPVFLGYLTAAAAIGAVTAAVALANTDRSRLTLLQGRAAVSIGVFVILFAVMPGFWSAFIVMFGLGASMSAFQSLNGSLVLSIADMEYHGRVQALIMFSYSAFGLAALPFGIIADRAGLRETMIGMGLAVLAASLLGSIWRRQITRIAIPAL